MYFICSIFHPDTFFAISLVHDTPFTYWNYLSQIAKNSVHMDMLKKNENLQCEIQTPLSNIEYLLWKLHVFCKIGNFWRIKTKFIQCRMFLIDYILQKSISGYNIVYSPLFAYIFTERWKYSHFINKVFSRNNISLIVPLIKSCNRKF